MSDETTLWVSWLVIGVSAGWFVWHVVKTFGFEGLALKFALAWDGLLICGIVAERRLPFVHWGIPKPHDGIALWFFVGAVMVTFGGWGYAVLSDRPTRWLLHRPRVKWPLYIAAVLILARLGIKEGWL